MSEIPALDDDAVLWSVPPDERTAALRDRPLLVLLHGYGSHEGDLFGLVPYLPPEFVVAAVRAPLTPPFPAPGWSWFPIEGVQAAGQDAGGAVTAASEGLLDWLARVAPDAEAVGLLGFSQGGAIALQTLRLAPERIAFAVVLAGFVADGELQTDAALATARPPVFWGRGARDEVIPAARVARTTEWLPRFVELSGRVYPGLTHSVSEEELGDVRAFLQKRLDDLAS